MNPRIWWLFYALLAAFCLYRLIVAVPQPLDASGTLRPILFDIFDRYLDQFDRRETAFGLWRAICYAALLGPPLLAVLHYAGRKAFSSRRLFFTGIAVCLLLCRFPTLLENEFNPDEGQFLASAHKLFYDPNFFHAVDTGTSGPINIYPMMLPAILGFSPDFASSRVMVMLILLWSTWLLYRSFALIAEERLARIAVLPFVAAYCVFQNSELVHYSSEHVPVLLIATGFYLAVRILSQTKGHGKHLAGLGLVVSAAFFAKMQSVPIVAVSAAVALAFVYLNGYDGKKWRPAILLLLGALPLPLINAVLCIHAGVWHDFWMSYIRANSSYTDTGNATLVQNLQTFVQFLFGCNEVFFFLFLVLAFGVAYLAERMRHGMTGDAGAFVQLGVMGAVVAAAILLPPGSRFAIYSFLALFGACAVPVYLVLLFRKGWLGADPVRWFGAMAFLSLAAAFFCVYVAHHLFFHYLLFLFVPLCACVAWMLMRQSTTPLLALLMVLVVAYAAYLWSFQDDHVFKSVAATIRPPEGEFIRTLTSPRGRIFVWGWTVRPYLGSGRVPSTRDTNVSNCFRAYNLMTWPPVINMTPASRQVSEYYVKRIVRDLEADPPEVFIDAVGPVSWFLNDPKYYGFDQFPEIAAFVKSKYKFMTSYYGERYYVRLDRAE